MINKTLHFDFNVDTGWQVEAHKSINRALRRTHDVDKTLVYAHFVLIARSLIDERRTVYRVTAAFGWKGHWTENFGARTLCSLNDRDRSSINDLVVIRANLD